MKKIFFPLVIFLTTFSVFASDYKQQYEEALKARDFEATQNIIKEWDSKEPKNIEVYIAYFNYYVARSMSQIPAMGKMKDGRYGLYSNNVYDENDLKIGFSYLDKALKINPKRLDVYFGKCSVLLSAEKYEEASNAIINLLDQSVKIKNDWYWTDDLHLIEENPDLDMEDFLFQGINDYLPQFFYDFYTTGKYMKKIVTKLEKLYPENIIGLNHCARYYISKEDYKSSVKTLKKAVEIDPSDYICLYNLGYSYELLKDYDNARACYEKMLSMENEEAKYYGNEGLQYLEESINNNQ